MSVTTDAGVSTSTTRVSERKLQYFSSMSPARKKETQESKTNLLSTLVRFGPIFDR